MSNLRLRLTLLNFLQFAVWGCYLISLGGYLMGSLGYSGLEVGAMYGTMGIASLFMPGLMGIIADKYLNAERLLALCHTLSAIFLVAMSLMGADYGTAYLLFLGANLFYMPTIALTNTICYSLMSRNQIDIASIFPKIRVWGTVGFIAAMWIVGLCGWANSPVQLYASAALSLTLAVLALTLPPSPPSRSAGKKSLSSMLGLDALVLFKNYNMCIFFVFSMLLGAALQITNTFGTPFLASFEADYADSLAVRYPTILLSLSQISETLFILSIPFFLRRFGIKTVMILSMLAWVLRFALFGVGNPGDGFVFLLLSMVVYGMAFDFFNVSGSMFVDREVDASMRGSAQGLFMMMTNGVGAFLGGLGSGYVVDYFKNAAGQTAWTPVWLTFAAYALVIMLLFAVLFRYQEPKTSR